MSRLLDDGPFTARNDDEFLREMNALSQVHLRACPEYRRIWPDWQGANCIEELPFVHVGLFKRILLKSDRADVQYDRTLTSSATTGSQPSQIALDKQSSALQSASSLAILTAMVGPEVRPLLVLDSSKSLRQRGLISARIAAAMSLRPLASEIHFIVKDMDAACVDWDLVRNVLQEHDDLLLYGFTWILWSAWANGDMPADVQNALRGKRIHFVHSGGWKKLEGQRVSHSEFDAVLLAGLSAESRVLDYYGLVEQVGIIYPLCEEGFRHVPRWAGILVRDPWTLEPLVGQRGLLQLMNVLAHGAPYHSVLTEDLGRVVAGDCPCGRSGQRFELLGRVPKAEVRGCANV